MENKIYNVKNRSASRVGYCIPEEGIRREFAPGEIKKIRYGELEKLSYQSGGRELMMDFLQIQSEEALEELGMHPELEYHMSETDIADLIRSGSLDQFLDFLDFAPPGEIDILKVLAVKIPLSDYSKREALKEKTGFDVDKAIANQKADEVEEETSKTTTAPGRRVQPQEKTEKPGRRYNVVSMGE